MESCYKNPLGVERSYLLLVVVIAVLPCAAYAGIQFKDITAEAGITYKGSNFSSAWGDFNGDGAPDLYTTNHGRPRSLYLNDTQGIFTNIAATVLPVPRSDAHGASWVDFDNDGDQDLMEMVGGSGPNHLFVNADGRFVERAAELGLDYPLGRGRSTLWYDWDLDGWLDVLLLNEVNAAAPTALFKNNVTSFENVTTSAGLQVRSARYANLYPITNDGNTQLIFGPANYPQAVYDAYTIPYQDLAAVVGLPVGGFASDVAIADFNGDALPDIFLVNTITPADAVLSGSSRLDVKLGSWKGQSVVFQTSGNVTFDLWPVRKVADIYIGSAGQHPASNSFQLAAQDQSVWGILDEVPASGTGVYIGYEPTTRKWTFKVFTQDLRRNALIQSTEPIENLLTVGFEPFIPSQENHYLQNTGQGFEDRTLQAIGQQVTNCPSVAAGDFDNDMDIDLYIACSGVLDGLPNILYENQGDGTFQKVAGAGGTQGSIKGQSDVVAVADIDLDGFLDLFVANGHGTMHPSFYDDRDRLFRNLGNSNHWIEIDLEGSSSNRDAIGALVTLTAGGITQQRFQSGGRHSYGQDFKRLHFGLAQNTIVDRLLVEWPSGIKQEVTGIEADQIIHILEGSSVVNTKPMISGTPTTTTAEDAGYGFIPTASDNNSDTLLFSISNKPAWATFNAITGELSGVPINADVGTTSGIVITVNDLAGELNSTVSLPPFDLTVTNVNDAPVANDDVASADKGSIININIADNDIDVDNSLNLASIDIVSRPENGVVTVNTDGTVDYTHTAIGTSRDSFTYRISDIDGAMSNTANVNITINVQDSNDDGISDIAAVALGLDPTDPDGDTDGDNIADVVEVGADMNNPVDSDSDGVIDALEPGRDAVNAAIVGALPLVNGGTARITAVTGERFSRVLVSSATGAPEGIDFPFGVISYTITSAPGGSVAVRMTFPTDLPAFLVIYKVSNAGVYTRLPIGTWTQVDARSVDITLTDGDPLSDLDGVVNGSIDDPVALGGGVAPVVIDGGGGGGGCVLYSTSGNDPVLPLLVLISVIPLFRRRFL